MKKFVPTATMVRKLTDLEAEIHNINLAANKAFKNCEFDRWIALMEQAANARKDMKLLQNKYKDWAINGVPAI